ncbi:hypothetical protein GGH94_002530 [Coemansia aciculifera]|uniref:N-acetyltransferase domain-containing protein n=1 Tax=Coemansia aciculifera TaxID=417176 RepID=A0A9W8IIQ4_9FUNG|nr:hypothetical protein GGH94_002530 [Coemansia aciculifera]KAJ2874594.1 hypothetical protein GGH93_002279 [Coemansia aciculifera]
MPLLKSRAGRQVKQQQYPVPVFDIQSDQLVSLIALPVPRLEHERHPLLSTSDYHGLVARCQQLEKRVFPKTEAMNLSEELRKPNQYLFVILQHKGLNNEPHMPLISYGVLALSKVDYIARITKVCTDPLHRGLGAGEYLVRSMLAALGDSSALDSAQYTPTPRRFTCISGIGSLRMNVKDVQLHVDTLRDVAVRMYTRCGFRIKTTIPNYYAEGRDALLMNVGIGA